MAETPERIEDHSIIEEMQDSYLTYAMSVITARALPDGRDGLKPSQRRILVAMNDLNLGPRSQHRKCAKIAGDTAGNYHPHAQGAQAVEAMLDARLLRWKQTFQHQRPPDGEVVRVIDGQDGDGRSRPRRVSDQDRALPFEVLGPRISTGMVEPDDASSDRINTGNVRPLRCVAPVTR